MCHKHLTVHKIIFFAEKVSSDLNQLRVEKINVTMSGNRSFVGASYKQTFLVCGITREKITFEGIFIFVNYSKKFLNTEWRKKLKFMHVYMMGYRLASLERKLPVN